MGPGSAPAGSRPVGSRSAAKRKEVPGRHACRRAEHGSKHGGPDARRLGLLQLPARRPADRPPVAQSGSEGPTAGIGSGILIARGDSSPRQNILICATTADVTVIHWKIRNGPLPAGWQPISGVLMAGASRVRRAAGSPISHWRGKLWSPRAAAAVTAEAAPCPTRRAWLRMQRWTGLPRRGDR